MNIGFASPVSLQLLSHLVKDGEQLPPGYQFAPAADWVQELMKRGHHVYLYTTARECDVPATFRGDGITIRISPQRSGGTGRDLFAAERHHLQRMMSEDPCDVIHAHWTYQFPLAALATGIPTLVTIHDLPWNVLLNFRDMHRVARLIMAYQVAMRGKYFTAVSKDAASHFHRFLRPNAQITVVPNGLPDRVFALSKDSVPTQGAEVVFATILRGWSRGKNASAAIEAFQIARKTIPQARLLMFGSGYEQGGEAHQWARQRGLDERITFVGSLPYPELLNRMREDVDVVVHPSLDESFSMTALEAMALKKPVIAGRETPGVREVLGFGDGGILVDVNDPEAIAKVMLRVSQDGEYRDEVARSGFNRAWSQYRLQSVMGQYEALYSSILRPGTEKLGEFRSAT
jgi:glycosyltransferase involved in cell wall biosynthesis